jgi:predicted metal-dependent hydrolase
MYNRVYFGGQLPNDIEVRFARKPMRNAMGTYCEFDELLEINPEIRRWRRVTCMVLLHEMAHVATPGENHGPRFQRVMLRLAKMGAFESLW